ncbi:MAG: hypothetical protein CXX80_11805 [Methanobacteriota archaeon]|nr:MAG: hypothetical protein CXX80_11805 [Euryarchaeota archaeon]
MAGLLDKASEKSTETNSEDNAMQEPTPDEQSKGGLLAQASSAEVATPSPSDGDELTSPMLKWGGIAVGGLLILFIFYQVVMGFNLGGYSFTFTDVAIDEEDNNLRLKLSVGTPLFGGVSDDPLSLSISYNGSEVWSGEETIGSKTNWFEIPLKDFYQGNVRDGSGFTNHDFYVVTATQGSTTTDFTITPEQLLDRTLSDAGGSIRTISENGDCPGTSTADGGEGTNGKCHLGAQFMLNVGRPDPINTDLLWHVDGDYSVSVNVEYSETSEADGGTFSTVFTFPLIDVDGSKSSWNGGTGVESGGSVVESSWMYMGGGQTDIFSKMPYLERQHFFDSNGDGCYRMSVTISHDDAVFGGTFVDTSSGAFLHWEENEDPNRSGDNQVDGEC